jgi:hypothetical protein
MYRQPVVSSNLVSVGYDANARTLEIEFHEGRVYRYSGVPESVYRGLMGASSKGQYSHDFIEHTYPFVSVS